MVRILISAAAVLAFFTAGIGNAQDDGLAEDKQFYITPYFLGSTLVGNLGVEFQYKRFAFDIGDLMGITNVNNFLTLGLRYYFNPYRSSWFVAVGGGISLDDTNKMPIFGYTDDSKAEKIDNYLGVLIGYRWKFRKVWNLNVGVGPATLKWEKIEPVVAGSEGKGDYLPMIETVIGYSF